MNLPNTVSVAALKARLTAAQTGAANNPRPSNQAVAVVKPLPGGVTAGGYLSASKGRRG